MIFACACLLVFFVIMDSESALAIQLLILLCVFYYCRTYYKAVRVGEESVTKSPVWDP